MKKLLTAGMMLLFLGVSAQQHIKSPDSSRNASGFAVGTKAAYISASNAIISARGITEKVRLYNDLLLSYADWRKTLSPGSRDIPTTEIIYAYLVNRDTTSANKYISNLTNVNAFPSELYGFANVAKVNQPLYAESLLRRAIEAFEHMTIVPDPQGDPLSLINNPKKYALLFYNGYAEILEKNGKVAEALKIARKAYEVDKSDKSAVANFAKSLLKAKRYAEAIPVLEDAIRAGSADEVIKGGYKELYVAKYGEEKFKSRLKVLVAEQQLRDKNAVQKLMISERSPMFNLQDLEGKTWSLADLKGKVVILDFWATWCAPCKKSFPAMQLAVNKYKNDPSVVFLFIHTWERSNNAVEEASKYIRENQYDFKVLMDLKKNGQNEAITAYKAEGIPAKYVIDGQGIIRFKMTGFTGSNEAAVSELSAMIDLAKTGV